MMAKQRTKSHHQLRHHRRDPHADACRTFLPVTPDEIASQAIGAAEAGAAILHLHARDPKTGRPTPDPDVFMQFLPRIKQATDAVVNITTGGGLNMTVDERLAAPLRAQAGDVLAQHGLDEFRHLPARRPLQDVEVRLGGAAISAAPTTTSSATPSATSNASSRRSARRTARASSTSATTSAISTISRISSTAAWSSRRSSSR